MNRLRLLAVVLAAACPLAPAAALKAVCLPDHTVVGAGERVVVRALSDASADETVTVTWRTESGDVSMRSDPSAVDWRPRPLHGALPRITARLAASGQSAECSAEVAVVESPHRGTGDSVVAVGSMLSPAAPEPAGYGLYSYVLFPRRSQTEEERQRMTAVLDAYLLLNGADAMEQAGVARSRLNATFLPIRKALPDDFDERDDKAAWLRNNYGYERAAALLLKLRDATGAAAWSPNGSVWVVSCLRPLGSDADPRPVLVQDLSGVPAPKIPLWMRRYEEVTTQPRLYDRRSLANLSLDLRIAIAQASDGLQTVQAAFKLLGSSVLQ